MKNVYLKGGGVFAFSDALAQKGLDVVGTTGQDGLEGWADLFGDRKDIKVRVRDRETGKTGTVDIYNEVRKMGYEVDAEKTFKRTQEIIQAENEKAERKAIADDVKSFEKNFGIDFSGYEKTGSADISKMTKDQKKEFRNTVLFPYSTKLLESGRYNEKYLGFFPKKAGAALMDVYSLAVRTPVAMVDDVLYVASKGKMGTPAAQSMAQAPSYGLEDEESFKQHFQVLQEAFRWDPLRVSKDLARESVRDPISGIALISALSGAGAPVAGSRAAMIAGKVASRYKTIIGKTVFGSTKAADIARGLGEVTKLKKTLDVMRKVNNGIETLNPIAKAAAKTGIDMTVEGGFGGLQGYLGKIFMGDDATVHDFIVEGVEEGAFGLIMSAAHGIPRGIWEKMGKAKKIAYLENMLSALKAVQEKLDNGIDPATLTEEELQYLPYTTHSRNNKVEHSDKATTQFAIDPDGNTVDSEGRVTPPTKDLPSDIDKNEHRKKVENPAIVTQSDKAADAKIKSLRNEMKSALKSMKNITKLFDDAVAKELEGIQTDAEAAVEAESAEGEKQKDQIIKSLQADLSLINDISKDTDFETFSRVTGQFYESAEDLRTGYVNFKVEELKAREFKAQLEADKAEMEERRKALRGKLAQKKTKGTAKDKVVVEVKPGEKYSFYKHQKVKDYLTDKNKKKGAPPPTDEEVQRLIKRPGGFVFPASKKGTSVSIRDLATQSREVNETLLQYGTENTVTSKAEMLPKEFTIEGMYFYRVSPTAKTLAENPDRIVLKDYNGAEYFLNKNDVVHMDPELQEPYSATTLQSLEDLDENFRQGVLANEPEVQTYLEKKNTEQNINQNKENITTSSGTTVGKERTTKTVDDAANKSDQQIDPDFNKNPNDEDVSLEDLMWDNDTRQASEPLDAVENINAERKVVHLGEVQTEIESEIQINAERVVTEVTPFLDVLKKKENRTEGESRALAVMEGIHSERVRINAGLQKRSDLRKKLADQQERRTEIFERISRANHQRAEKIREQVVAHDAWANSGSVDAAPEPANVANQEKTVEKAIADLKALDESIFDTEDQINEMNNLDQEDFNNQLAFNMIKKAKTNGYKSFAQSVLGKKPEKHSKNVSSAAWEKRTQEIRDYEMKVAGINELLKGSFSFALDNPVLADMIASQAWGKRVPSSMKDAKTRAHNFMRSQSGFIDTGVFREAAKFGAAVGLAGDVASGGLFHIGYQFLIPFYKRFFNSSPGRFLFHSVEAQLRQFNAFQRLLPRFDQAFHLKARRIAQANVKYKEATIGMSRKEKNQVGDFIDGLLTEAQVSPDVARVAEVCRGIFAEVAVAAGKNGWNFSPDRGFFPRVLNFEAIQTMKENPALVEENIHFIMKNDPTIDRAKAAAIIAAYFDNSEDARSKKSKKSYEDFHKALLEKSGANVKTYNKIVANTKAKMSEHVMGSLQHRRVAPRLISSMYIRDLDQVMLNYISGTWQAITHREKFGKGLAMVNDALFAEFKDPGGGLNADGERFKTYIEAELFNKSPVINFWGKPVTNAALSKFTRYQFYSKLMTSALASARNFITASVMSNSIYGVSATSLGLLKMLGNFASGHPFRNAHLAGVITDSAMRDVLGQTNFELGKITQGVMKVHPFTISEHIVRTMGYNAGTIAGRRLFSQAKKGDVKAIEKLSSVVGEERLVADLSVGVLSKETSDLFAAEAAHDVAGTARPMKLSPFLSTAEGKVIGQYRRIAFQQSVVLKNKILKPALRGNIMPLMRWGAAVGLGAPAIAALAAAIYGERDEDDMSNYGEEAWALMKFINQINSLGLFGDLAASYEHGTGWGETPVVGTFVGPTISTIINMTTDISSGITKDRDAEDIIGDILKKEFPGIPAFGKIADIEALQK